MQQKWGSIIAFTGECSFAFTYVSLHKQIVATHLSANVATTLQLLPLPLLSLSLLFRCFCHCRTTFTVSSIIRWLLAHTLVVCCYCCCNWFVAFAITYLFHCMKLLFCLCKRLAVSSLAPPEYIPEYIAKALKHEL